MLKAKKIRLDVNAQDAATLEFMQIKYRGLYNWWVMCLREGQRWKWQDAKKTLAESRKYDPDLNQVYGKRLSEVYFRSTRLDRKAVPADVDYSIQTARPAATAFGHAVAA